MALNAYPAGPAPVTSRPTFGLVCNKSIIQFILASFVDKIFISTMPYGNLFIYFTHFPHENIYFQKTPSPPPRIRMVAPLPKSNNLHR